MRNFYESPEAPKSMESEVRKSLETLLGNIKKELGAYVRKNRPQKPKECAIILEALTNAKVGIHCLYSPGGSKSPESVGFITMNSRHLRLISWKSFHRDIDDEKLSTISKPINIDEILKTFFVNIGKLEGFGIQESIITEIEEIINNSPNTFEIQYLASFFTFLADFDYPKEDLKELVEKINSWNSSQNIGDFTKGIADCLKKEGFHPLADKIFKHLSDTFHSDDS